MDYSKEEIGYVEFCVNNAECSPTRRVKCPVHALCYGDEECQGLCERILASMNNGEILPEEDRAIVGFFYNAHKWWMADEDCWAKWHPENKCPNRELCEEREGREEKLICDELVQRLDLDAQKIAEKEIQKAIISNCPSDWGLEEKVVLVGSEEPIPEINGRIDIRLRGEATATIYIVELKLRATREHVGQLASYVGWCKNHPMPGQTRAVRGILLAEDFDEGALSALEACPDLMPRTCRLRVDIGDTQWV